MSRMLLKWNCEYTPRPVSKYTVWLRFGFMVFNTTFNNISVISWRSVLLVEETECPEKTTDMSRLHRKL